MIRSEPTPGRYVNEIRVVFKRPGVDAETGYITNDLKSFQSAVDGYIEAVPFSPGISLIVNEEGRLRGLTPNVKLGFPIVGNIIAAGFDRGGDFQSLDDDQLGYVSDILNKNAV